MKQYLYIILTLGFSSSALLGQGFVPPTELKATWGQGTNSPATTAPRTITLQWKDNATNETGYGVERKIGTGAWADLVGATAATALPAGTTTYTDATIARGTTAVTTYYYYRVRAKSGTLESGAAEVATIGVPFTWPDTGYDADADGITNAVEAATSGMSSTNWADGTGDSDGDLMPNAWEANLGTNMLVPNTATTTPAFIVHVTVDASRTAVDTATETKTITAAIGKLTGATAAVPNPYRIILVKPGVYAETINNTSVYQIAFIADRSGSNPKKECEIQGIANSPVISTTGSAVFDGFVITRASGTSQAAFVCSESATPLTRVSTVRLVNCIVRNMDNGADSIVEQSGGRLVLAHNTFYMNSVNDAAPAHSYSAGILSGTSPLQSTARLQVQNCIFWNPINTRVAEFASVGDYEIKTSIFYGQMLPGTAQTNPGLTPKGYLMNANSSAIVGGTSGIQVLRDMHGELRFDPPGRGADDWVDQDNDQIPDFADTVPQLVSNAGNDGDFDGLYELDEYQAGTSLTSFDSQYLTLDQAMRLFTMPEEYLTRAEGDGRYMPLNPSTLRKVRIAPGGNIDMGEFD